MFAVPLEEAVSLYAGIVMVAMPIALVFGLGNIIIGTFLTAAFGGGIRFGGGRK